MTRFNISAVSGRGFDELLAPLRTTPMSTWREPSPLWSRASATAGFARYPSGPCRRSSARPGRREDLLAEELRIAAALSAG